MNTLRLALVLSLAGALLTLATGCATTRLSVTTPEGLTVGVGLPKNMDATRLRVSIGDYELTADRLITDASGVIREKNQSVSAVSAAVATAVKAATLP